MEGVEVLGKLMLGLAASGAMWQWQWQGVWQASEDALFCQMDQEAPRKEKTLRAVKAPPT